MTRGYRSIHLLNLWKLFKANTHRVLVEGEENCILLVVHLIIAVHSTIVYICPSVLLQVVFPLILHSQCRPLQDQTTTPKCLTLKYDYCDYLREVSYNCTSADLCLWSMQFECQLENWLCWGVFIIFSVLPSMQNFKLRIYANYFISSVSSQIHFCRYTLI
jgi:hypothetical protein